MKEELKEIKVGIGLGNIKFGMTKEEVKEILGEADEVDQFSYTDSEDKDLTESWHYDELELSLGFDQEEDWKLTTISVTSDFYELDDKKIFGLNEEELIIELNKMEVDDVEVEDCLHVEELSHKLITSDILGVNFWFDNNLLSEIQWGPLYSEEENIVWPE